LIADRHQRHRSFGKPARVILVRKVPSLVFPFVPENLYTGLIKDDVSQVLRGAMPSVVKGQSFQGVEEFRVLSLADFPAVEIRQQKQR